MHSKNESIQHNTRTASAYDTESVVSHEPQHPEKKFISKSTLHCYKYWKEVRQTTKLTDLRPAKAFFIHDLGA